MAVINQDRASIIYQATTVLLDKTLAAVRTRSRKDRKQLYGEAAKIRYYLVALTFYPTYFDAEQANQILQCLVVASGIQDYPVPPVTALPSNPASAVLLKGDQGEIGPRGNDGGATDFAVTNINGTTVLDSFLIGSSYGARWDYAISSLTSTIRRSGTVYGSWLADGSAISFSEVGTSDVGGVSIGVVTLSVDYSGGNVRLNVGVSSGLWEIRGSRYLIPNQGVGVNVSSTPLPSANLFIGNASSVATAQAVTGDIAITNGGVTSINSGVIVNADINASAAIATTKLAALANNNAVTLTNGSGFITSIANGTSGYVLTSNGASAPSWQMVSGTGTVTSVNASGGTTGLSFTGGPVTTTGTLTVTGTLGYANGGTNQTFYGQGDIIYASAANTLAKRAIGTSGQVLTVSGGVPVWATVLLTTTVTIGDWNIYVTGGGSGSATKTVAHGLADFKKIRGVQVILRNDSDTDYYYATTNSTALSRVDTTNIYLQSNLDFVGFSTTGYNRGWVTITYTA